MFDKEQIIMDDVMAMDEKIQDEQYQAFVNKFKPKKQRTTAIHHNLYMKPFQNG